MRTMKRAMRTRSTSRKFSSLFVLLVVSGCCCECGPKKESYVSDVPATTKAAAVPSRRVLIFIS